MAPSIKVVRISTPFGDNTLYMVIPFTNFTGNTKRDGSSIKPRFPDFQILIMFLVLHRVSGDSLGDELHKFLGLSAIEESEENPMVVWYIPMCIRSKSSVLVRIANSKEAWRNLLIQRYCVYFKSVSY